MRGTGKYKKRLIVLVIATIFVVGLAWNAAFYHTIKLWQEDRQLEQQLSSIDQVPFQVARLTEQLKQLDRVIGNSYGEIGQQEIVEEISKYIAKNPRLALCSLPPEHNANNKNYRIKTYTIELEGSFESLVKFLHYFEKQRSIGKFASASFFVINDQTTKRKELRLKIFIQTFDKRI